MRLHSSCILFILLAIVGFHPKNADAGEKATVFQGTFHAFDGKSKRLVVRRSLAFGVGKKEEANTKLEFLSVGASCKLEVDGKPGDWTSVLPNSVLKVRHSGESALHVLAFSPFYWRKLEKQIDEEERQMRLAEILLKRMDNEIAAKRRKEAAKAYQEAQRRLVLWQLEQQRLRSPAIPFPSSFSASSGDSLKYQKNVHGFLKLVAAAGAHLFADELRQYRELGDLPAVGLIARNRLLESGLNDLFPSADPRALDLVTSVTGRYLDGYLSLAGATEDVARAALIRQLRSRYPAASGRVLIEAASLLMDLEQFQRERR